MNISSYIGSLISADTVREKWGMSVAGSWSGPCPIRIESRSDPGFYFERLDVSESGCDDPDSDVWLLWYFDTVMWDNFGPWRCLVLQTPDDKLKVARSLCPNWTSDDFGKWLPPAFTIDLLGDL